LVLAAQRASVRWNLAGLLWLANVKSTLIVRRCARPGVNPTLVANAPRELGLCTLATRRPSSANVTDAIALPVTEA